MNSHGHMLMRCIACGRVLNHAYAKWCKGGKCRARYKRQEKENLLRKMK